MGMDEANRSSVLSTSFDMAALLSHL